ncbi:MAG TPA: ABC transporter substrate-binding protein [Gaiellaceae bacterium]|nr:ABC transporter substrate-binding protein [Gaiellaceae bacterium]HET8652549.1 ABC transporter substrate-binding protein [Gaiellaceae bacterium]
MTKLRALLDECGINGSTALTSAFGCYKLTLPADTSIDVDAAAEAADQAEEALAAGDLDKARSQGSAAAALARRSFLPGEDGSWVEERRRDLREILVRALECLRDASLGASEFPEAVRYADEVIELEPFRESGYRRLMQAHAAAGNPAEALRVYERCRRFLADELGAYPSPETEAAYLEILRAKPASATQEELPVKEAPPRIRRQPSVIVTLGALVLAGAVAAGIVQFVRDGGGGAGRFEVTSNGVAVLDADSGAVRDAVVVPAPTAAMATGLGFVWAASADSNMVVVIDPTTNTVRDTIPVESAPGGIAIAGDWVWVTNSLTGTVSQISPQTLSVVQTIPVGNGPTGIAAGNGHVWVANTSDHTLSKLRATDGKVVETFAAGSDPGAVALGEGAVWVASKLNSVLVKLSPSTGEVLDRIPVGDGPAGVAVGGRSVWVANSLSGTVSRLDPRTGDVRGTFEIGSGADAIAVAREAVWVASGLEGTIARIDVRDVRVTTLEIGSRPTALAVGQDTVYIGHRPSGAEHVGGTLRVLFSYPGPPAIDTATAYAPQAWRRLVLTNDGLVGWRRVGGQAGTELVPDLAVSLPSVSGDGRKYTFQLRRGIRYSDGRLLKASDVRYSIERLYKLKPAPEPAAVEFYQVIVGANRCRERPSRCDLSRGIVTDDQAGTVTFRLATPDPEFLFKLALPFAYVVPAGTTMQEAVRRPLPATGAYRVASVSQDGSLRLVRNLRFREWSSAAQPAGYPDEIVVRAIASAPQRARLVARGRADYMTNPWTRPSAIAPVHRPQLHVQPLPGTFYLALDTTRPPFDDLRARRALNFAVDRDKVIQFGQGPEAAKPTCQVLPPNFPGYERYCLYTLDANAASRWTAPDLLKARSLIAASRTTGAEVVVWWHRAFGTKVGQYLEQLLDSLGYRARLRLFSGDIGRYWTAVERRGTSWHVSGSGWSADYPAASIFINLLSCSSHFNWGRFCDRAIDAKARRAARLQEKDPAAANKSWAEIDRDLTDLAPWVPLYTEYGADFVSKRVGNYQHHPLWGALFAQLWVR